MVSETYFSTVNYFSLILLSMMIRINIIKGKRLTKVIRPSQKTGQIILTLLCICSSCSSANRKIEEQHPNAPIPKQLSITSAPGTTQEACANETEVLKTMGQNEHEVNDWYSPEYKLRAFLILHKKLTEVADYSCPTGCKAHLNGCDIKGNISYSSKERIFHAPEQEYYAPTVITPMFGERWFCTEEDAIANGWRKSRK